LCVVGYQAKDQTFKPNKPMASFNKTSWWPLKIERFDTSNHPAITTKDQKTEEVQLRLTHNELQRAGFTRVIPNVWSRGTTFHQSRFAPVEPPLDKAGASIGPICTLAAEGQKRGIKVMPWFEYGLMELADA
jgi:uncharacterized lipoprotein YddW (UPF0748 family)